MRRLALYSTVVTSLFIVLLPVMFIFGFSLRPTDIVLCALYGVVLGASVIFLTRGHIRYKSLVIICLIFVIGNMSILLLRVLRASYDALGELVLLIPVLLFFINCLRNEEKYIDGLNNNERL